MHRLCTGHVHSSFCWCLSLNSWKQALLTPLPSSQCSWLFGQSALSNCVCSCSGLVYKLSSSQLGVVTQDQLGKTWTLWNTEQVGGPAYSQQFTVAMTKAPLLGTTGQVWLNQSSQAISSIQDWMEKNLLSWLYQEAVLRLWLPSLDPGKSTNLSVGNHWDLGKASSKLPRFLVKTLINVSELMAGYRNLPYPVYFSL